MTAVPPEIVELLQQHRRDIETARRLCLEALTCKETAALAAMWLKTMKRLHAGELQAHGLTPRRRCRSSAAKPSPALRAAAKLELLRRQALAEAAESQENKDGDPPC